jgi:hypothetical protein
MMRRYLATATQQGPHLTVTLSGGLFSVDGTNTNRFHGVVQPAVVRFDFLGFDPWDSVPFGGVVAERLTTGIFVPSGRVAAAGPPERLAGPLDGYFDMLDYAGTQRSSGCYSSNHQFLLAR